MRTYKWSISCNKFYKIICQIWYYDD